MIAKGITKAFVFSLMKCFINPNFVQEAVSHNRLRQAQPDSFTVINQRVSLSLSKAKTIMYFLNQADKIIPCLDCSKRKQLNRTSSTKFG